MVKYACANAAADAVVTYSGGDKTAPTLNTGASLPGGTNVNACKSAATTAPTVGTIAALYADNCGQPVVVTLASSNVTGDDCSWTATYTYTVKDACGNAAADAVVTYSGGDKTAP